MRRMRVLPLVFMVLEGGGLDVEGIAERGAVGWARALEVLVVVFEPLLRELWDFDHGWIVLCLKIIKGELNLLLSKVIAGK